MAVSQPEKEVRRLIAERGRIPFFELMEICLYGDGGYYSGLELPIGKSGDFVTGSSFSPLFGRSTARVVDRLSDALGGRCDYLECGYGAGTHLRSLLEARAGRSAGRVVAWDRVRRPLPAEVESVESLAEIADGAIDGLIFSYELFDALAVHRVVGREDGGLDELWVTTGDDGELIFTRAELSDPTLSSLLAGVQLEADQVADVSPGAAALYRTIARKLRRGLVVTCDYGFERRRLVDARVRRYGTLACYSRQRVHRNPLVLLGRQDLTAHVDFTSLREAGEAEGLHTVTLSRQALWLLATSVFEDLEGADLTTREEAMGLLDGEGMGEDIRVLVQARGVEAEAVVALDLLGGRS